MRGVLGKALQGGHYHGLDAGIVDRARRPRARPVTQTIHAMLDKTPAPFADRRAVHAQPTGHVLVLFAFRAGQHDPSPQGQRLSRLAAARQRLQFRPFLIAQRQ
jgi:hypothetical protein